MLTTFEQVKDWITDNGFKRWVLYKDSSKTEKIIDSANFTVSDMTDKLAMTEKYLRMAGGRALAAGAASNATSDLITTMQIQLENEQPTSGISGNYPSIGELTETITKQVRAEIEVANMKQREKDLERREKEFEAEKQSALGAIVHYFAPIGQMLLEKKFGARVAGVDANEPVHAAPIVPDVEEAAEEQQEQPKEEEIFTDEEADKLFALMARFKKADPDYLIIIEKEVEMAEAKDSTYTMAKGFLIK